MFRRLKLNLTLSNLSVIFMLFVLLALGIFFQTKNFMDSECNRIMDRITNDVISGRMKDLPRENEKGPLFFFVIIDAQGRVAKVSSSNYLSPWDLQMLTGQTLKIPSAKGSLRVKQIEYRYQKSNYNENKLIVFQNFETERSALGFLLMAVGITGLVCLILSFFGSMFMANRAMIPIQKSWQQQRNFLADVSHELRTPLAVIKTNLDIALFEDPENKWLKNVQDTTDNMAKLVDSLLFLSRADAKELVLNKSYFSLNQVIDAAVEPFLPIAQLNQLFIQKETGNNIVFCGDEARIKQLVGIVLDNAIKHTPCGGSITVSLQTVNNNAILILSDTGEGISPEHVENIFDRFYQADPARSQGGVGLGLAIAKWIVEEHHGRIKVSSNIRQGTTFTVSLPIEKSVS